MCVWVGVIHWGIVWEVVWAMDMRRNHSPLEPWWTTAKPSEVNLSEKSARRVQSNATSLISFYKRHHLFVSWHSKEPASRGAYAPRFLRCDWLDHQPCEMRAMLVWFHAASPLVILFWMFSRPAPIVVQDARNSLQDFLGDSRCRCILSFKNKLEAYLLNVNSLILDGTDYHSQFSFIIFEMVLFEFLAWF